MARVIWEKAAETSVSAYSGLEGGRWNARRGDLPTRLTPTFLEGPRRPPTNELPATRFA
jgi:hypothetical protein